MVAQSTLVLHCGARHVDEKELAAVKTPPAEGRWHPVSHVAVVRRVKQTLAEAGYAVRRQQLGLSRNDQRLFGTLDLVADLARGVTLAVGIRTSLDKSFPMGFVAGQRTFICDNLAFRSELLVKRKHTLHGTQRFASDIAQAVARLADFRRVEAGRIQVMQHRELSPELANSLILTAYEKGIVSAPYLPRVIKEWRHPSFAEFRARTLFNLFQAFTTALADKARKMPSEFAVQTMRLNHHLLEWKPTDGDKAPEEATA